MDAQFVDSGCGCSARGALSAASPSRFSALDLGDDGYSAIVAWAPAAADLPWDVQRRIVGAGETAGPELARQGWAYVVQPNVGGLYQHTAHIIGAANADRWPEYVAANVPPDEVIRAQISPLVISIGEDWSDFSATYEGGGDDWPGVPYALPGDGPGDFSGSIGGGTQGIVGFTSFQPGKTTKLPDAWAGLIEAQKLALGAYPAGVIVGNLAPVSPGGATGDALRQAQVMLAAWGRATKAITPQDYGETASDFNGIADQRTTQATASYQRWANAERGESLRTDGVLDQATRDSLSSVVSSISTAPPSGGGSGGGSGAATPGVSPALVVGAVAALGIGAYLLAPKGRRR